MASSSSSVPTRWKYDVFLSFRGEDTRYNFVDHLYTALKHKGIHRVFRDEEELERGREISPELVKAIEASRFFIIVFSENYAFSRWCLDELSKIIDCTKKTGQIAFPIFYNVDPSDVRKQTGSFANAFAKHAKENPKENMEKMQRWRNALLEASNLAGWDSRNRHEAEFIQEIVHDMFRKLNPALLHLDNNLVGMDFHLKELNIRLSTGSKDVKFVGIYGLGGIGKTTIAKAVYNMISYQFEECGYLENVKEISEKNGSLQEQLLDNILREKVRDGRSVIKNRLSHKKVLVFLDDVDHRHQLEKLAGNHDWFGPGSRVIITTRDEHLLESHGVDERYKVEVLDPGASLELFSWKAFKLKYPTDDFAELSDKVVDYAKGLPIALDVLGSFLRGRSKTEWNSALDKLKKVPNKEVINVLKISYDGLEDKRYKDIFLDIACFFKGKDKGYVTKILDSCDFYAVIGIKILIERSLISLSENNRLLMHDLVQEMGRDIVFQESPEDPSKRSRLWLYEDIRDVLMNKCETQAVEAIMLDGWHKERDLHVSANACMKMYNLRLFQMDYWPECSLECFPSTFQPKKLVELSLRWSHFEQLWNGVKALGNLISIDLSFSENLIKLPDLTGAPILEQLILDGCINIVELHPSVGLLRRLKYLSLNGCSSLRSLPSNIEMESLETLDLCDCFRLEKLPELLGNMVRLSELYLEHTGISEVPSSIENITGLKVLNLSSCWNLERLPSSICRLEYLEELLLHRCSKLENLPENLGNLKSLVELDASATAIKESPPSIVCLKNLQNLNFGWCKGTFFKLMGTDLSGLKLHYFSGLCSLTYLNLSCCNLLDGMIPSDIGSLSSLEMLDLGESNVVNLPISISQLSRLTTLDLVGCEEIRELPELPSSLATVNAHGCTSLERLSNLSTVFKPENVWFCFANCSKFANTSFSNALQQFKHQALFGNSETFSICLPGSDIPGWFSDKYYGSSVSIQLPSDWYNTQLRGLAFCVVVHDVDVIGSDVDDGIIISKSASSSAMEISYPASYDLDNDHVIYGYISRAWFKENVEKSELEFRFFTSIDEAALLPSSDDDGEEPCVKTWGIRLIYDEDNEKVNIQPTDVQSKRRRCEREASGKALNLGVYDIDAPFSDEPTDEDHCCKMLRQSD